MGTLIVIRHGEAVAGPVDHERALSPAGREQVSTLVAALRRRGVRLGEIRHSGLVRARETAEMIAEGLSVPPPVIEASGLGSADDPESLVASLVETEETIAIVSHVPFVRRLTALLLDGDAGGQGVGFAAATAACLMRTDQGWSLAWVDTPA